MTTYLLKTDIGLYVLYNSSKDLSNYIGSTAKINMGKVYYSVIQIISHI